MPEQPIETSGSNESTTTDSTTKEFVLTEQSEALHTISAGGSGQLSLMIVVVSFIGLAFGGWWLFASQIDAAAVYRQEFVGLIKRSHVKPIPVGILHSLTGTMATSEVGVVDATMLAIQELNQKGGLLGRPIQPILADGASLPHQFAQQAHNLITKKKVVTIFGCWTSSSRKAVKVVVEQHNHLLLYPVQYEGLESSPNIFYLGASPNQQLIPAVQWAFHVLKKRRFFLIGSDYVFPRAANAIIKDHLKKLGASAVGEVYIPLGITDVSDAVKQIKSAQPDVVLNTLNGSSNLVFFSTLRKAGIHSKQIPTISFSIAEPELQTMNIWQMLGDYAAWNYFQSLSTFQNATFIRRFKQKYGMSRVISDPMQAAYVGVHLWAQAVRQSQSLQVNKIRKALQQQSMLAPEGAVRIEASNQHMHKTARIGQIQENGQFRVVWQSKDTIPPQPFPNTRTRSQWLQLLEQLKQARPPKTPKRSRTSLRNKIPPPTTSTRPSSIPTQRQ